MTQNTFRQHLLRFTACSLVALAMPAAAWAEQTQAAAQADPATHGTVTGKKPKGKQLAQAGLSQGTNAAPVRGQSEEVRVRYQRLLQRTKNAPSAVTELGEKQIAAVGFGGSTATLLRQAPSVYVYQQGVGQNSPVFTIRGVRGLEVAQTLDGIPTQDLIYGGTGSYLSNNIASAFSLDQISGSKIYPGVAYPNQTTFGTIGGTVAWDSKRPAPDRYFDVFGSVGSFQTFLYGFEANSGAIDGPFGHGANAPSVLLRYQNEQTAGFVNYTDARYGNMEFALDKPYDDGLSKFQATVLYNYGRGYLQNQPTPIADQNEFGRFTNYSKDDAYLRQTTDYLTVILKNDTYVNDTIPDIGLTLFYLNNDNQNASFENLKFFKASASEQSGADGYPVLGSATSPFAQVLPSFYPTAAEAIYSFAGIAPLYGGDITHQFLDRYRRPGVYTYDPTIFGYSGALGGCYACGLNYQNTEGHSDTYGFQPRMTIIVPHNTIQIGGLVAKETTSGASYNWGAENMPEIDGYNSFALGGGAQRTIFSGYAQDKISLLNDTLLITPGFTIQGTYSSNRVAYPFTRSAGNGFTAGYPSSSPSDFQYPFGYTVSKFDRNILPFINVTYNFDRIAPVLKGVSVYGSYGTSALYSPVSDFTIGENNVTVAPSAAIVSLYEAGLQYNTNKLFGRIDYFYQKVNRDFGFFQGQGANSGINTFNNNGGREFKGVEFQGIYQATPRWQLFGNFSHLLAKYTASDAASVTVFQDQFGYAFSGQPISGIPDWLAQVGVEYDHKSLFRDQDTLSARLTMQYTGQQYTTVDLSPFIDYTNVTNFQGYTFGNLTPDQKNTFLPAATTTDTSHKLPEFAVFNLDVQYTLPTPFLPALKQLKFDLNIQNLFDARYNQYYYNQYGAYNGLYGSNRGHQAYSDAIPGEPFAVLFTTTARF